MLYNDILLHNVAEVQPVSRGVRLQRVPETVRSLLNPGAQKRALQADNCEIRFVCESDRAEVTLCSEGRTEAMICYGPFDSRERILLGPEPTTISLELPAKVRDLAPRWREKLTFDPRVRRVIFGGRRRDAVILHGVDAEGMRPPQPGEVPALRYLAYGTSITQGFDCDGPHLSYAGQVAWRLGADLINLGMGGACHCERALADSIAGRDDWDIATLALSVNMQGFSMTEFRRRVEYMVNTVAAADATRPVVCITLFPFFRDFGQHNPNKTYGGTPEEYRLALREIVAACPHPNVHLLEGKDMLTDIGGLSTDLIHPSGLAMVEMGQRIAEKLKQVLSPHRTADPSRQYQPVHSVPAE